MIVSVILYVMSMMFYTVFSFHPLENTTINCICSCVCLVLGGIFMYVAYDCYDKFKSRIKALEDKLNDKEERK